MKQRIAKVSLHITFALVVALAVCACASSPPRPVYPSEPIRTVMRDVQTIWNTVIPPVTNPLTGVETSYRFEGDVWYQLENGKNVKAGKMIFRETNDGYSIEMRETHNYVDRKVPVTNRTIGWQKIAENQQRTIMKLEYNSERSPQLRMST